MIIKIASEYGQLTFKGRACKKYGEYLQARSLADCLPCNNETVHYINKRAGLSICFITAGSGQCWVRIIHNDSWSIVMPQILMDTLQKKRVFGAVDVLLGQFNWTLSKDKMMDGYRNDPSEIDGMRERYKKTFGE